MKILKNGALIVLLNVLALTVFAQGNSQRPPLTEPDYNKPKLFADLPERFKFDVLAFEALLDKPLGEGVNAPLALNLRYHGTIISKSDPRDQNVKSVIVKSTNRQGATLTFTRIINEDGGYEYKVRLMSLKHSDAFELEWANGDYVLTKKHLYDIFTE